MGGFSFRSGSGFEAFGEPGFGVGEAGSGVDPVREDEGRVRVGLVRCQGLCAAPFGAGVAEGAEGGGVAARLGGEVAAEAEHVGPGPQAEVFEVLTRAEGPGGADKSAGM